MLQLFLITLLFLSPTINAKDLLLPVYCKQYKGKVESHYTCPKSHLTIPFDFCVIKREGKPALFFDGCTGPMGGFEKEFYPACITHDLCYHQEPATRGWSQKQCDEQLLKNLTTSCNSNPNKKSCQHWAQLMYRAVRMFGKLAYNCANFDERTY